MWAHSLRLTDTVLHTLETFRVQSSVEWPLPIQYMKATMVNGVLLAMESRRKLKWLIGVGSADVLSNSQVAFYDAVNRLETNQDRKKHMKNAFHLFDNSRKCVCFANELFIFFLVDLSLEKIPLEIDFVVRMNELYFERHIKRLFLACFMKISCKASIRWPLLYVRLVFYARSLSGHRKWI